MNVIDRPKRLATPTFPIGENLCAVVSNAPVNDEYNLMVVAAPHLALTAAAGQFFHLLCPRTEQDSPYLRRPMSVYRIDRKNEQIAFLYKVAGAGTRSLARMKEGDILDALGPLGVGFSLPKDTAHVLMVARGVGLATLAPLAEMAKSRHAKVTAFLSARRRDLVMSRDELEAAGANIHVVTDEDGDSSPATLGASIAAAHERAPFDFAATCGSNRLFKLVKSLCADWRIEGQTALEARMGCGTGMCFACVTPTVDASGRETYKRVCTEGPVFDIKEAIAW